MEPPISRRLRAVDRHVCAGTSQQPPPSSPRSSSRLQAAALRAGVNAGGLPPPPSSPRPWPSAAAAPLRAGVVGVDSSHGKNFARLLNGEEDHGCRVVAYVARGTGYRNSGIISNLATGIQQHRQEMAAMGIPEVADVPALLATGVDVVLVHSWDGRVRLEQTVDILRARKPAFLDKPVGASLADVLAIFTIADALDVPIFSCSSLRWSLPALTAARNGDLGELVGCDAFSPASLERELHLKPDLFFCRLPRNPVRSQPR
eukprot:COSAG04_NODE_406_length_14865_cov_3.201801_5_plen_260_part_00